MKSTVDRGLREKSAPDNADMRKKLLWGLSSIAFADVTQITHLSGDEDGVLYSDTDGLSDELKFAIKSVKTTKEGVRIEMEDKMRAMELLGKYFGVFSESTDKDAFISLSPEERRILKKYEERMKQKRVPKKE